jgi:protein-L-isoaspartate(D-aspartate) O-methyltransferase
MRSVHPRRPGEQPVEQTQADLVDVVRIVGIEDRRLISAFEMIPRAGFVPEQFAALAYEDRPLPIPHEQVTTQPSLSALMIDALELRSSDRVLEVGSGYGFQTALLAQLCKTVTSLEIWAGDGARRRRFGSPTLSPGLLPLRGVRGSPTEALMVAPMVPAPIPDRRQADPPDRASPSRSEASRPTRSVTRP